VWERRKEVKNVIPAWMQVTRMTRGGFSSILKICSKEKTSGNGRGEEGRYSAGTSRKGNLSFNEVGLGGEIALEGRGVSREGDGSGPRGVEAAELDCSARSSEGGLCLGEKVA